MRPDQGAGLDKRVGFYYVQEGGSERGRQGNEGMDRPAALLVDDKESNQQGSGMQ